MNGALGEAFDAAEAILLASFGRVTLAALSADFHRRLACHPHRHSPQETDHDA